MKSMETIISTPQTGLPIVPTGQKSDCWDTTIPIFRKYGLWASHRAAMEPPPGSVKIHFDAFFFLLKEILHPTCGGIQNDSTVPCRYIKKKGAHFAVLKPELKLVVR